MKALFHPDEPRDSSSDSDLAQIDPVLVIIYIYILLFVSFLITFLSL